MLQSMADELAVESESTLMKALLWVVEVGLQSPLPPKYEVHFTSSEGEGEGQAEGGEVQPYYVNSDTQESQWEHPLLPYIKQVVEVARLYIESPYEHHARWPLWQQHRDGLRNWHGPYLSQEAAGEDDDDADGGAKSYFVNEVTGVSSWEDPRVEAQYLSELQSALLQKLQSLVPPVPEVSAGLNEFMNESMGSMDSADVYGAGHGAHGVDAYGNPSPYGATAGVMYGMQHTPGAPDDAYAQHGGMSLRTGSRLWGTRSRRSAGVDGHSPRAAGRRRPTGRGAAGHQLSPQVFDEPLDRSPEFSALPGMTGVSHGSPVPKGRAGRARGRMRALGVKGRRKFADRRRWGRETRRVPYGRQPNTEERWARVGAGPRACGVQHSRSGRWWGRDRRRGGAAGTRVAAEHRPPHQRRRSTRRGVRSRI